MEPICCPYCAKVLTNHQVRQLFAAYANSRRKTRSGGRNGGRPRKQAPRPGESLEPGAGQPAINPQVTHYRPAKPATTEADGTYYDPTD